MIHSLDLHVILAISQAPLRLCIAAEKKWSLRTNCPTYDDSTGCSKQAETTQNQTFTASTVPETVKTGTVQAVMCRIKMVAESSKQQAFQP